MDRGGREGLQAMTATAAETKTLTRNDPVQVRFTPQGTPLAVRWDGRLWAGGGGAGALVQPVELVGIGTAGRPNCRSAFPEPHYLT